MRSRQRLMDDEHAALRRVATLVARGSPPEDVFAAVTEEVGQLLPVDFSIMARYEPGGTATYVASWESGERRFQVGGRWPLEGNNLVTRVFETRSPARLDSYADASGPMGVLGRESGFRAAVATPIVVDGHLWGAVVAGSTGDGRLPADTEESLAEFTELLATAIANAESRAGLARLAEEQAALRRVATLVAQGAPPKDVFAAVTEEVGQLFPVDLVGMGRYEPDYSETIVASWGGAVERFPVGSRLSLGGNNLVTRVFETGRPARKDSYADASGQVGVTARETGFHSSVGTPIIVEGRVWGVVIAGSSGDDPLPADLEARLTGFTELLATAVANAESRAALAASRARIVAAADRARRRIERDLHDGTQQRLVALMLELGAARATVPPELAKLRSELERVADGLATVFDEVREISRGIHPAVLAKGGLKQALKALARRSAVPVQLDLRVAGRLPAHIEVAAYYVVSEGLANAVKHARASLVYVQLDADDALLRLAIHDDGVGGADPADGSGLVGLRDRIETLGGRFEVISLAGSGTTLLIEMPLKMRSDVGPPEA
jgi:signal transduction histidine kinase